MDDELVIEENKALRCIMLRLDMHKDYVLVSNHCSDCMVAVLEWTGSNNVTENVRVAPAGTERVKRKSSNLRIAGERPC